MEIAADVYEIDLGEFPYSSTGSLIAPAVLDPTVPGLWKITVHETCNAECAYYGPGDLPGKES